MKHLIRWVETPLSRGMRLGTVTSMSTKTDC
ncbi:hypothetical protein SRABI76_02142 [Microbacterium oxydans]|uniref:Uncharacterized protein n=1 Tax=Microbacterium oxydans TaxID=82380 RepID=A0A0F0LGH0_9MICO|nr:hypothetical protein RS83_00725 [Microbacterium oxydans]CAH0206126.1 hypothetical protein SRABI76_02142 [Microbacterium oxydans]